MQALGAAMRRASTAWSGSSSQAESARNDEARDDADLDLSSGCSSAEEQPRRTLAMSPGLRRPTDEHKRTADDDDDDEDDDSDWMPGAPSQHLSREHISGARAHLSHARARTISSARSHALD